MKELLCHAEDSATAEKEDEAKPHGDKLTAKHDSGIQVCPEGKNVRIQTNTRVKSVGKLINCGKPGIYKHHLYYLILSNRTAGS